MKPDLVVRRAEERAHDYARMSPADLPQWLDWLQIEHFQPPSARDRSIVERLQGLTGPHESVQQISPTVNLTWERVRQIERQILRKCRFARQRVTGIKEE